MSQFARDKPGCQKAYSTHWDSSHCLGCLSLPSTPSPGPNPSPREGVNEPGGERSYAHRCQQALLWWPDWDLAPLCPTCNGVQWQLIPLWGGVGAPLRPRPGDPKSVSQGQQSCPVWDCWAGSGGAGGIPRASGKGWEAEGTGGRCPGVSRRPQRHKPGYEARRRSLFPHSGSQAARGTCWFTVKSCIGP